MRPTVITFGLLLSLSSLLGLAGCGSSETTGGGGSGSSVSSSSVTSGQSSSGSGISFPAPMEIALPDGSFPQNPRISPDGTMIAFMRQHTTGIIYHIEVVTLADKQLKTVGAAHDNTSGVAWTSDSKHIYFTGSSETERVAASGGPSTEIGETTFGATGLDLSWDDTRLIYDAFNAIQLVDLKTPNMRDAIAPYGKKCRFSPDGKYMVYWSDGGIMLMDLTSKTVDQLLPDTDVGSMAWFSDGKRLAMSTSKGIEIVTFNGTSSTRSQVSDVSTIDGIDVSRDGTTIAYIDYKKQSISLIVGF